MSPDCVQNSPDDDAMQKERLKASWTNSSTFLTPDDKVGSNNVSGGKQSYIFHRGNV